MGHGRAPARKVVWVGGAEAGAGTVPDSDRLQRPPSDVKISSDGGERRWTAAGAMRI